MTEQIKIMDIINHWGYLTAKQIALLLNKNQNTIGRLLDYHASKGFYKIDQHTRKKFIIFLTRVIPLLVVNIKKQLR